LVFDFSHFVFFCGWNKNMAGIFSLHNDVLNHISWWFDSKDVIAFKDSCRAFRTFAKLHLNNVSVARVGLEHRLNCNASGVPYRQFTLQIFVTVGHTASTSLNTEIQLGGSANYKTAMAFWKFVGPKEKVHIGNFVGPNEEVCIEGRDFTPESEELLVDNVLLSFSDLPELVIRNRDLERIYGIVNAQNVIFACPSLKRSVIFGDRVLHLDFLVPTECPDALQFEGDPHLQSFCLQIRPLIGTELIESGKDIWGIRHLQKCTSLKELTLDIWNCCGNVFQWACSLNRQLGSSIPTEHLQQFVCLGALNLIDPKSLFWKKLLGMTAFSSSKSGQDPEKALEVQKKRKLLSLKFGAEDDSQDHFFRETKKKQMKAMANQFMKSPRLRTLSFELSLLSPGRSSASVSSPPELHSSNLSNFLAMVTLQALCTQKRKCSNLTHLSISQPAYKKTVKEMVASHTVDLQFFQYCHKGCPDSEDEDEFCYGRLVDLFPAVLQNCNGVPFIKTDIQFDVVLQCKMVEAIAKNPFFCRLELMGSRERLTYAIYCEQRGHLLKLLRSAKPVDGEVSKICVLSQKEFSAIVHRKLVYTDIGEPGTPWGTDESKTE
jgi:hypothetical protein